MSVLAFRRKVKADRGRRPRKPPERVLREERGWSDFFFPLGGFALALYRGSALSDVVKLTRGQGIGGVTLAYNARRGEDVEAPPSVAKDAGRPSGSPRQNFSGAAIRVFRRPGQIPLDGGAESTPKILQDGRI